MSDQISCPDPSGRSALRLGIIGTGRISQVAHLPAATKADGVQLVAVCDARALVVRQVARRYGVLGCTEIAELLENVDAVLVATPDSSHLAVAAEALRAGKHVLVEKPLADNAAAGVELNRLAAAGHLKLQVGAMKRHDPGIEFARQARQRIGPVHTAQAWYRVMSALRPPTERTLFPKVIVDHAAAGGPVPDQSDREQYLLRTHGAHVFDGVRYLIGEVASLRAEVARAGPDFSWHGTGRLVESAGLASFEISASVHGQWAEGFDVYGERGHLRVRSFFPFFRRASEVTLFTEDDGVQVSPLFSDTDPYERQLEAFARAVIEDGPTNPDGLDGIAAVRFIEAVRDSAGRRGAKVML
jgi:predicted dehydrogenase